MNTSIKQKKEMWPIFIKACESQWLCGGDRYALAEGKEFTDLICEAVGNEWIGGNIIKYVGEIKNTQPRPEVNFFKMAVWAFLWWIKEQENLTERDKGEEFSTTFYPHFCRDCNKSWIAEKREKICKFCESTNVVNDKDRG